MVTSVGLMSGTSNDSVTRSANSFGFLVRVDVIPTTPWRLVDRRVGDPVTGPVEGNVE